MDLLDLNDYLLLNVDVRPPRGPESFTAANAALILTAGKGDSAELCARSQHGCSAPDSFCVAVLIKKCQNVHFFRPQGDKN